MIRALRVTPALLLFFLALSFVAMGAHESTHHVAGRLVCGRWGTMALSTFYVADGCETNPHLWITTLAGPTLTYALIWLGAALRSRFGALLIFANLPFARAFSAVIGKADEMVLARQAFGSLAWPILLAIVALLLSVPLLAAWRWLPERGRWWRFCGWLVLPMLWDFTFKRMLLGKLLPAEPLWNGWPVAILASYAVALAIVAATARAALQVSATE